MADPLLIAPDNRLLGWALTDLTLYGGQPAPGMTIGRAVTDGGEVAPLPDAPASSADASTDERALAANDLTALLNDSANEQGGSGIAARPPSISVVASITTAEPSSMPHATGAGSFVQTPVATPLQRVEATADVNAPAAPSPDASEALEQTAGQPLDAIAPVLAAQSLGAEVDTIAPVLAATPAVAGTMDTVIDAPALPPTELDAIDQTMSAVDALPIESFGGTDPAAGLATLVGMVESSETFDIADAVAVPETSSPTILDALAADSDPSPLLGDDHAGLDHPLDDGGIHVGL